MAAYMKSKEIVLFSVVIFLMQCQTSYSYLKPASRYALKPICTPFPVQQRSLTIKLRSSREDSALEPTTSPPKLNLLKSESIDASTYLTVFGLLPVLSFFTFDILLSQITDFNLVAADRQLWIIALLLSKRLYIYALALTTVDLAAKRSVELPGSLGQRLFAVNAELFKGVPVLEQSASPAISENKELYAALDTIDDTTQATALPLLVAGSLLVSFLFLGITSSITQTVNIPQIADNNFILQLQQQYGPYLLQFITSLTLFWNAAVCALFSKSEIQAVLMNLTSFSKKNAENADTEVDNDNDTSLSNLSEKLSNSNAAAISLFLSLVISLVSFLSPPGSAAWCVQNVLNICIAVTVARAAQLPRLPYIVLALVGLVCYDVAAVVGTQQFSDGGASIMEAVARAKAGMEAAPAAVQAVDGLTSAVSAVQGLSSVPVPTPSPASSFLVPSLSSWRPGLFQVVVGGRVSDVLGLADVVFPAILAGWSLRYDVAKRTFFEGERENSLRIIKAALTREEPEPEMEEVVEVKRSFFERVRGLFSSQERKIPETDQELLSKEQEREQSIIAIVEDEKIEVLNTKIEINNKNSVFSSSLLGYGLGCFMCEIFQTGEGQPALLYIVPSMFFTVFISGFLRGELSEMWGFNPDKKEEKEIA